LAALPLALLAYRFSGRILLFLVMGFPLILLVAGVVAVLGGG
jgi:hypothetical protein